MNVIVELAREMRDIVMGKADFMSSLMEVDYWAYVDVREQISNVSKLNHEERSDLAFTAILCSLINAEAEEMNRDTASTHMASLGINRDIISHEDLRYPLADVLHHAVMEDYDLCCEQEECAA